MTIVVLGDIVEKNGRSIRDNNMDIPHNIPIGKLVEVKYDTWYGDGACEKIHARLWVTEHRRDCDGSPLYSLGTRLHGLTSVRGFAEESLTLVAVTEDVKRGVDSLDWD